LKLAEEVFVEFIDFAGISGRDSFPVIRKINFL